MLATMSQPNHDSHEQLVNVAEMDEKICPGCKLSAVSEQGGLVVAFG